MATDGIDITDWFVRHDSIPEEICFSAFDFAGQVRRVAYTLSLSVYIHQLLLLVLHPIPGICAHRGDRKCTTRRTSSSFRTAPYTSSCSTSSRGSSTSTKSSSVRAHQHFQNHIKNYIILFFFVFSLHLPREQGCSRYTFTRQRRPLYSSALTPMTRAAPSSTLSFPSLSLYRAVREDTAVVRALTFGQVHHDGVQGGALEDEFAVQNRCTGRLQHPHRRRRRGAEK